MHGFSHLRTRVRVSSGLEPFPARSTLKRMLDHVMYGVGIIAPLALLPQIIQIYSTKSSAGVSLVTWLLLTSVSILWAVYAAVHNDKQLFFANFLVTIFNIALVIGLIMY